MKRLVCITLVLCILLPLAALAEADRPMFAVQDGNGL